MIHAIGLMSGTSADAMDAAAVLVDDRSRQRRKTTLVAMRSIPFPADLRSDILLAQEGELAMRRLLALHAAIGKIAGEAAAAAFVSSGWGRPPEVVGFHGQTVFHDPHGERSGHPLSAQIGEPAAVARAVDSQVVSNFRVADVLAGGEGAPLVPLFDYHQFGSTTKDRVLLNVGGIANLTRIRPGAPLSDLVAFDCGPGNMVLDGIVAALGPEGQHYDSDGAMAAAGSADPAVVREFLADPFFDRKPPKSAGREEFGITYRSRFLERMGGRSLEDRLRTAVEITAQAVGRGVAMSGKKPPDEVIVSGGGAKNPVLLEAIRKCLAGPAVVTSDAYGVPPEAKEAMAFAFLAVETIAGRPGNVPSATGAKREVVLGSITPAPVPWR